MSMAVREGECPFAGGHTWFRITGDLAAGTPLVVLHGGPGAAHDYLDRFDGLAAADRAVVQYDQFGCGRSSHRPDAPAEFWSVGLFLDELDTLLGHLGITAHDLLGQSWGGMLGAEHAARRPADLARLVIANSPADMHVWVAEANRLRADLPPEVQATLLAHEAAGTTGEAAYEQAVQVFYDRHLCRVPWPPEVVSSFAQIAADPTVYHTMNGPSEFHVVGHIRDWTIADRVDRIAVPTLVYAGEFDEATAACIAPYRDRIPGAVGHIFPGCSHMPHVEATAECLAFVDAFLRR